MTCEFGLVDSEELPHRKPWRAVTSSWRLAKNLNAHKCKYPHGFVHSQVAGLESTVFAGVHHLIDRRDWQKRAGYQAAIDKEANGLIANQTWSYDEVVPRDVLLARKEPLNVGRLMTILSNKHFETPELRRLKARIVFEMMTFGMNLISYRFDEDKCKFVLWILRRGCFSNVRRCAGLHPK